MTMTDKLDVRLDGVPDDQMFRAIVCARGYAHAHPDRRGIRQGVIYAPVTGNGPALLVYRTASGRLVCRVAGEKGND